MFRCLKIKNLRLTVIAAIGLILLLTVCLLSLRSVPPKTVSAGGEDVGVIVHSDEEIEAFIAASGCAVEGCVSDESITVPKTWNETYEAYNELQQRQGFNLRLYKGKTVRKLVYAAADSDSYVTVLVSDGRIIAADICAARHGSEPEALIE